MFWLYNECDQKWAPQMILVVGQNSKVGVVRSNTGFFNVLKSVRF